MSACTHYMEESRASASAWFSPAHPTWADELAPVCQCFRHPAEPSSVPSGDAGFAHPERNLVCPHSHPARLQPPLRDPPGAQTHNLAAGPVGWSLGKSGHPPEGHSPPLAQHIVCPKGQDAGTQRGRRGSYGWRVGWSTGRVFIACVAHPSCAHLSLSLNLTP